MTPLRSRLSILAFALAAAGSMPALAETPDRWSSFWTADDLKQRIGEPNLLIIDVRSEKEYAEGHIPGAINLPGSKWRTPSAKPDKGASQDVFLTASGEPDVAKYEKLLGGAGVTNEHTVVIYGSHAGKADGSVPAAILQWLGHDEVAFLDGVGIDRWKAAGGELSTEATTLEPATYKADPEGDVVWHLDEVLEHIGKPGVVFFDTRSPKEFSGEDLRDNKRGGHIPGAVLFNYEDMMSKDTREVLPPAQLQQELTKRGIDKDETVVLYCQTATRTTLPQIALRELGYKDVVVYDASWQEYGNRDDTPVEGPAAGSANVKASAPATQPATQPAK